MCYKIAVHGWYILYLCQVSLVRCWISKNVTSEQVVEVLVSLFILTLQIALCDEPWEPRTLSVVMYVTCTKAREAFLMWSSQHHQPKGYILHFLPWQFFWFYVSPVGDIKNSVSCLSWHKILVIGWKWSKFSRFGLGFEINQNSELVNIAGFYVNDKNVWKRKKSYLGFINQIRFIFIICETVF